MKESNTGKVQRRAFRFPSLRSERGVAMLMAIFTFIFVSGISMELLEDTQVEYITASQNLRRLQSYYTAKSGVEMSLLRILIYQKAQVLAGDALGSNASLLDQIWAFPFIWPPVVPENVSAVDKEIINSAVDNSLIEGAIATQITSEGSKIDINDLASPSETLAENTQNQILRILQQRVEGEDVFSELYRSYDFETLVGHMADWVDEDQESRVGGDERTYYRDISSDAIPPNQPFKTIEELHMVEGMTDDIFEVLRDQVTVFGVAGIQVNTAPKEVLMSIDEAITEEAADLIIERRSNPDEGGPFADLKSFSSYLSSIGLTLDQENLEEGRIPLIFDSHINFRIVSTGSLGQTTREIVAIVYDFDKVKERVADQIKKDDDSESDDGSDEPTRREELEEECRDEEGDDKYECLCQDETETEKKEECIAEEKEKAENDEKDEEEDGNDSKKKSAPKGRPNVVFWFEK